MTWPFENDTGAIVKKYDKNPTFFQMDFEIPGHFTSFRKPSAAYRLFQRFGNDRIKFYRKDT